MDKQNVIFEVLPQQHEQNSDRWSSFISGHKNVYRKFIFLNLKKIVILSVFNILPDMIAIFDPFFRSWLFMIKIIFENDGE